MRRVPANGELVYKVPLDEAHFIGADKAAVGGCSDSWTGEWLIGVVTR